MTPPVTIDVTAGFVGEVLGSVPINEATSRIRVYCTSRYSGWAAYDLADVAGDAYFAMLYMLGLFRWRVDRRGGASSMPRLWPVWRSNTAARFVPAARSVTAARAASLQLSMRHDDETQIDA